MCICVGIFELSCLKNIRESSSQEAFKMVGRSKFLSFRQVVPSRSITLLRLVDMKGQYFVLVCVYYNNGTVCIDLRQRPKQSVLIKAEIKANLMKV